MSQHGNLLVELIQRHVQVFYGVEGLMDHEVAKLTHGKPLIGAGDQA